jgi:hypothetical protein
MSGNCKDCGWQGFHELWRPGWLGVGIDESQDDAGTGRAHCPMTNAPNSDADYTCCDSVPTPNAQAKGPGGSLPGPA